ncbi:MAG: SRPBCC domain-containing protein [Hyphomicrobium sp.]
MTSATVPAFQIERTFDFPRALVWQAHAEAEHLMHWWGPKGCKLDVVSLEFRPGGLFRYAMRYSTGAEMFGRFYYRDIATPDRLAYLSSFANAEGGMARAPFSPVCPLELLNTATFSEKDGKTILALRVMPFGANTEEIAFFNELCNGGLQQGFGGTYDQLAAYLETVRSG